MLINENLINEIVSQEIVNVLCEAIKLDSIGQAGPLKSELIDPNVLFHKEIQMAISIMRGGQYVNLDSVFGNTLAYKVYKNYERAMMSKNGKIARGFLGWLKQICQGKFGVRIMAFREGDNFIFGYYVNGFFIAAYFAPSSPMGKFKIIQAISKYDNIVFPVTQDLSDMLQKLGFKRSNTSQNARWRNMTVQKDVFGTSDKAVAFGIQALQMWNH